MNKRYPEKGNLNMDGRLAEISKRHRRRMVEIVSKKNASHIGSMLSVIDILVFLYYERMNFSLDNYKDPKRDRLILSKGHASLAVYSILNDIGIIDDKMLEGYYSDGGKLIGHLDHKAPGVEVSTGSLGHGLAMAVGMALGNRMDGNPGRIYCIIGDGECNEGSVWESLMFGAQMCLTNLTVIVDSNKLQGYDYCKDVCRPKLLSSMIRAIAPDFSEIDGHDFSQMRKVFSAFDKKREVCRRNSGAGSAGPDIIMANTIKGKGVSFMEGKIAWHYKSPTEQELMEAIGELR